MCEGVREGGRERGRGCVCEGGSVRRERKGGREGRRVMLALLIVIFHANNYPDASTLTPPTHQPTNPSIPLTCTPLNSVAST